MKELAYSINAEETFKRGILVLDLYETHKENYVHHFTKVDKKTPSQWRQLTHTKGDQEAFSLLVKIETEECRKREGHTFLTEKHQFNQLQIPTKFVSQVLTLLAPTQKVFFNNKQLVIDLFESGKLSYEVEMQGEGRIAVKGKIRWRDCEIALADCGMVGPGTTHWFIHGITLKTISTEISWNKLLELFKETLFFEGTAKQTFLDEFDPDDAEAPQLVFINTTKEQALVEAIPYPILILKDRWGSFADLWMDYGQNMCVPVHFTTEQQEKFSLKRQREVELSWEKDLLETDFIKKIVDSSHYYCPLDKVSKSLSFLLEIGWHIEDVNRRRLVKQTGIDLNFEMKPQALAVQGKILYETHEADIKQVIGAFNRKETFLELSRDNIGLVPFEANSSAIQELSKEGEIIGSSIFVKKCRFNALTPLWQDGKSDEAVTYLKEKCQNFHGIKEVLPAATFTGSLRHYQQEGVNWLAFLSEFGFHGILADEMGLGKTVQILAFLSTLPKNKPHLIVVPTSLLFNWKNEIAHFLPSYRCTIHQGPYRVKDVNDFSNFDIVLTSYTILRTDISLFRDLKWSGIILDEAQTIKNAMTQTAQAVRVLTGNIKINITGTPVENHLGELWAHFHFLMPELLGSKEEFDAEIASSQVDRRHLERIKRKVFPFILRRLKKDVAMELPPRIDQLVWIKMEEDQRQLYDRLVVQFKAGLLKKVEVDGFSKHRLEILEAILRLRQICCDPILVSSYVGEDVMPKSAKFQALFEDLDTLIEEGHKVLVYSQFTSMLKLMAREAQKRDWSYGYLDGSTVNREEVVQRFQKDPSQMLFFISLKAGGVGLNLTAADYVYLYDPWWNDAVEEQAINRAHRIGREEPIVAKKFVVSESIEEKMMKLKKAKKSIIEEMFDSDFSPQALTMEDLSMLIG